MKSRIPEAEVSLFYEVRQAALALCCTEKHVYDLIRDGKIRAIRIGKKGLRIERQSVEDFVAENLVDPVEYYA